MIPQIQPVSDYKIDSLKPLPYTLLSLLYREASVFSKIICIILPILYTTRAFFVRSR